MAKHNEIGRLGEDIACRYLRNKGHEIVLRNFRRKWGEIDIITKFDESLIFVEVKTVTVDTGYVASGDDSFRPEDMVHDKKRLRLRRVIDTYLTSYPDVNVWRFDVVTVKIELGSMKAFVNHLTDIIL